MAIYITHIINQPFPTKGFRKVGFYTKDSTNTVSGEYFLGTDNNPFTSDNLEELIIKKKIYRVKETIEIKSTEALYVDCNGNYYLANYLDSSNNRKKIIGNNINDLKNIGNELKLFGQAVSNPNYLSLIA